MMLKVAIILAFFLFSFVQKNDALIGTQTKRNFLSKELKERLFSLVLRRNQACLTQVQTDVPRAFIHDLPKSRRELDVDRSILNERHIIGPGVFNLLASHSGLAYADTPKPNYELAQTCTGRVNRPAPPPPDHLDQ